MFHQFRNLSQKLQVTVERYYPRSQPGHLGRALSQQTLVQPSLSAWVASWYMLGQEAFEQLQQEQIAALRSVQAQLLKKKAAPFVYSSQTPHWRTTQPSAERINRALPIMVASFSVASVSQLFFPPLGILSLPGAVYATWPIYQNAYCSLRYERKVHVHTLFTITAVTCIAMQYYFYYNLAALFYVASRKLLLRVHADSRRSLIASFDQQPRFAWVLIDDTEVQVPIKQLQQHDLVIVHTGETIPVDGIVVQGMASVDQRALTGEAQPAEKRSGEAVFAATVVLNGTITIAIERAGNETIAAQITRILQQTANVRSDMQLRAEALADRTVLPMLAIAGLALPLLGPLGAVAVINAHFGYRVAVIAPISMLIYFRIMSQQGILVKDGYTLDLISQVDTLIFDKTGTLTEEQPHIGAIYLYSDWTSDEVLSIAATAEAYQTHPIAQAIRQEAQRRQLDVQLPNEAAYEVGYGLVVRLAERVVHIGSHRFLAQVGITLPPEALAHQEAAHQRGESLVLVACDQHIVGAIKLCPTIRPEAHNLVRTLRQSGIKQIYIISGDHELPTRTLAAELGLDGYFAETLPQDKAAIIGRLQAKGHTVCYVGDGINDAIALKQAHVSVSLRGAATIATDTAQIVLMTGNLTQLSHLFAIARDFDLTMRACFAMILLPTIAGVSGIFMLDFGLPHTILLKQLGLLGGLASATYPLLRERLRKTKLLDAQPPIPRLLQ